MAGRTPTKVAHGLRTVGENLRDWRRLNRLTQAMVAERANVSEQTVRTIESGKGSVSAENLLRVMHVLGLLDRVINQTDPMATPVGRARAEEALPKKVRPLRLAQE